MKITLFILTVKSKSLKSIDIQQFPDMSSVSERFHLKLDLSTHLTSIPSNAFYRELERSATGVIVLTSCFCVCVCVCVTTLTAERTDILLYPEIMIHSKPYMTGRATTRGVFKAYAFFVFFFIIRLTADQLPTCIVVEFTRTLTDAAHQLEYLPVMMLITIKGNMTIKRLI